MQINIARVNRDSILLIHLTLKFKLTVLIIGSIVVLPNVVRRDRWRVVLHVDECEAALGLYLRHLLAWMHQR